MSDQLDVLVLGAGPSGSTVAHLLARAGHSVRVLEKAVFPRFHIGESLLPCDLPVFERLGFEPKRGEYLYKEGAEFLDEESGDFAVYDFADGLEGTPPHAWQVERARFDHELANLAADAGADIRYGVKVVDYDIGDAQVSVTTDDGETHVARFFIDASGQDAFLARRRRTVQPIKGFGIVAAGTHFSDLRLDARAELEETGNVKILMLERGWGWVIPLTGGRLSTGCVTRDKTDGPEMVDAFIESSPLLQHLTEGATRLESRLARNFSYLNTDAYGPRYACVGDSAAFIDPVFSSGVSLGMIGAELVADCLAPALAEGREADADLMGGVKERLRVAYIAFGSLIKSFYHTQLVRHFFFHPDPDLELRAGLISLLAGDCWRDDNKFQNALVKGRRRWEPEHELGEGSEGGDDDGPDELRRAAV